jgi:hypothetical protein
LLGLLQSLPADVAVYPLGADLPVFDLHCPIMSLPLACQTGLADIPAAVPYLFPHPEKLQTFSRYLGQTKCLRVGLVWSGSSGHLNDHNRSIALSLWQPLLQQPAEFHCLQKEIREQDAAFLADCNQIGLHQDAAALLDAMDLVISVDTAVAHLAGAMGKPVWILLPYAADFRWLLQRDDSPWYPTACLFRQPAIADWQSVIDRVAERLAEWVAEHASKQCRAQLIYD